MFSQYVPQLVESFETNIQLGTRLTEHERFFLVAGMWMFDQFLETYAENSQTENEYQTTVVMAGEELKKFSDYSIRKHAQFFSKSKTADDKSS